MAGITELFGSTGLGSAGTVQLIVAGIIGLIALLLIGIFFWWLLIKRKKWNIKVEFKIPRNVKEGTNEDGENVVEGTITKEWGRGFYDASRGVVHIKRKGKRAVPMKPFDIKRYLSTGANILTVIQVGIEDYRPILDDSYLEVEDDETGEMGALINAKIDTSESKSWRNMFERDAKATYTFMGWLKEHGQLIGFGFIILMIIVGFAIVIGRMP